MTGTVFALVVAICALGIGIAYGQTTGGTFTGCLKSGQLSKVAVGTEPTSPCVGGAVEVSWNEEGVPGTNGIDGKDGTDGKDGRSPVEIVTWDYSLANDSARTTDGFDDLGAVLTLLSMDVTVDATRCVGSAGYILQLDYFGTDNLVHGIRVWNLPAANYVNYSLPLGIVQPTLGDSVPYRLRVLGRCFGDGNQFLRDTPATGNVRVEWTHATPMVVFT